ncbi:DUF4440 domain-containing protein [Cupriavidus basilensis]|uniref:DUF4440 domain-containing protein n=1 Tax=Cupriavidus basilensis TaxID=68895 RepID=A0ABT6ATT0_9BURK|nr:DUF4440 domain-containing protein [Cupriavidus basilensis]MDF3836027.1 DUF4440 domain-containing protein [Cupriavidus basilensis]
MMDETPFFTEIVEAHVAIQAWFCGQDSGDPDALASLLSRFSPQFSMITPAAAVLDFPALRALFSQAGGRRPGLRIAVSDLRSIGLSAGGATILYREHQVDGAGVASERWSTVVFERNAQGKILWRHLHETMGGVVFK